MKRFIKSAIACVAAVAMVATVAPVTTYAASTTVVSTQKALDAAIKAGKKNITIKTTKAVKITISKASSKANIVIDAKNATITNKSSVKSLTIKGAKAFTESGKFNEIKVATNQKMTLTVAKGSVGADITVAKANAKLTVKANGDVSAVSVEAKGAKVALTGTSDSQVVITAKADNASISSAIPADINVKAGTDGAKITAKADVKVSVAKNATLDKVSVAAAGAAVNLNAKGTVSAVNVASTATGAKLDINASGKVASVTVNAKADVAVAGSTNSTVKVTVNAADTTVTASTAVDTTLNADAKVDLTAGAEGSKVTAGNDDVKADVSNGTKENITITDSKGNESTVEAGKDQTTTGGTTDDGKKEETTTGGGGNPGSSEPSSPTYKTYTYKDTYKLVVTGSGITEKIKNDIIVGYTVKTTDNEKEKYYSVETLKTYIKGACEAINAAAAKGDKTATYSVGKNVNVTISNVPTGSTDPIEIKATYGGKDYIATVTIGTDTVTVAQKTQS